MFFMDWDSKGYDNIKAISTSKIKNSKAIKKNWNEKGTWDGFMASNPHSNWVHFSFSASIFFCTIWTAVSKIIKRISIDTHMTVIFIFLFSFLLEIRCTLY